MRATAVICTVLRVIVQHYCHQIAEHHRHLEVRYVRVDVKTRRFEVLCENLPSSMHCLQIKYQESFCYDYGIKKWHAVIGQ